MGPIIRQVVLVSFLVTNFTIFRRSHAYSSKAPKIANPRKVAQIDGDIIIGALFPIHEQPTVKTAFTRKCGAVREQYGIHRVEVFIKTIRQINSDPTILPNITLGVDIRDTCWYPPVALEQSIDFIRNSLAHLDNTLNKNSWDSKCSNKSVGKPIASLIGPGSSSVTIQVQNLLQLFKIPQIGYSATSMDLSQKMDYPYFMRVVPPDNFQVQVIKDIIVNFGWKFISLVSSKGSYGNGGIKKFKEYLEQTDICTDNEETIDNKEEVLAFQGLANLLFNHTNAARVVVCFCQGETVEKLFDAMIRLNYTGQGYLVLGSDGWADRTDILGDIIDSTTKRRHLSDAFVGGISVRLSSPKVSDFDQYFQSLTPRTNTYNPWFQEFWEQKFNCQFYHTSNLVNVRYSKKPCTGNESLASAEYNQDNKLGFVINSIYTVALALDSLQRKICNNVPGVCKGFLPVSGPQLLEHLLDVNFTTYSKEQLTFDRSGDPPGRYDIMNYQRTTNKESGEAFGYHLIGTWREGVLTMSSMNIQWPEMNGTHTDKVESICSKPCGVGQIKVIMEKQKCCWKCKMCLGDEIIIPATVDNPEEKCDGCGKEMKPDKTRSRCLPIEVQYMKWSDKLAIIAMVFSCVGIIVSSAVISVFAKFNNTPMVKASTRELMYIILAGVILSYGTTFVLIAKPSKVTCSLGRLLPGFSFSLMYGSLVTKTNRIARILAGSKKKIMTRKPRFLSTSSQLVITAIYNAIEISIIIGMLIYEPAFETKDFSYQGRVHLVCNTTTSGVIIPLAFDAVLVCLCTLYAIQTRNLPENFNEAKFIGFTMYTTCIIWIGLVPIYFGSENKVISMCFAMSLTSTVALVLLFCPKLYIIIFKPEKNIRSAFTTSKEIRCHFGTAPTTGKAAANFKRTAECVKNSLEAQKNKLVSANPTIEILMNSTLAAHATTFKSTDNCSESNNLQAATVAAPSESQEVECQTEDNLVLSMLSGLRRRFPNAENDEVVCIPSVDCCISPSISTSSYQASPSGNHFDGSPKHMIAFAANCSPTKQLLNNLNNSDTRLDILCGSENSLIYLKSPTVACNSSSNSINSNNRPRGKSVRVWIHDKATDMTLNNVSRVSKDDQTNIPLVLQTKLKSPTHSCNTVIENTTVKPSSCQTQKPLLRKDANSCSSSSCHSIEDPIVSMEDMSVLGLRLLDDDECSANCFHSYLLDRGVELDLDSIQMSEV